MEEERLNEEEVKKQMLNDKDCEIDNKREDKIGKLKDCEMGMEPESLSYPNQRVPTIYSEPKKHLFEMLSNGDETESLDQSDSFPESSNEIEILRVSVDPNPEEEEDPKFQLQKKLPDSFPEYFLLSASVDPNPNPKIEEEEGEEDPKFKLQKKLLESFPESSDETELPSVSVDPDPNPKQEEEEGEEDPKFKLQKKLLDSIFQKKLMERLDQTFFCL